MNCVVISRNGKGEAYRFDSLRSARLHPIPQMDDVYACSAEELVRQYGRSEIEILLPYFEGRDKARLIHAIEEWKSGRPSALLPSDIRNLLWDRVLEVSKQPPASTDEILSVVVADRKAREGVVLVSRPDSSAPQRFQLIEGTDEMTDKAKREVFRMEDEGTIGFGTDDKGVAYSAENTPKRGEATKGNFAKYTDGMTVKEALATGLTRSNIRRDRRAGFITITNPEKPAEEPAKTEEAAAE